MAAGTLYSYPENFRASKAQIAAQYAKTDVKLSPNFVFGKTNKTKEFLKKFPSGKVPAFEAKDGKCLQDSNAIAYYVANEQLRGKTDYDKAQVLQWIGFAESEVLPAACAWVFPILGIIKNDAHNNEAFNRAKEDIKASLSILNGHLLTHTYLVGERVTLADIVVACNLLNPYKYALDPDYRKPFVNVNRWFNTLLNQPQFKSVLGQIQLCSKPAQPAATTTTTGDQQPPQPSEGKNKKKDDKKEKKQQQQQQQKKATPKKEESDAAQEPEEELDAADAALAAEPKSKDPTDSLPKGTFNMDDYKRFYSNQEEAKSIPYFWEKFDPENYSIWFCEYKYPEELNKVFMSCNLIAGMYQRLDKLRKVAFASMCLFGEDNNSTISGVWVWRGHELIFTLSPDWQIDYESYDWKKLDPKSEEAKNLVAQYFSWTGTDKDGRKFNQGKIFK